MVLTKDEAVRDAERLLDIAWRETGGTLPVDPVKIARSLGIDVFETALDSKVSGALIKEYGQDPTILLNAIDSQNRQRFTCAHEIGHFVRRSEAPDQYEYVDYRDQVSSKGTDLEEVYANAFAAALLMPEELVRGFHRKGMLDFEMAWQFDVSREAMNVRLRSLGLL